VLTIIVCAIYQNASAQINPSEASTEKVTQPDTLSKTTILPDSLSLNQRDNPTDSLNQTQDSIPPPRSDIATTIKYTARDSIITDIENQKIFLYGDAKIDYGDVNLKAERIEVDYKSTTLTANYALDSAGKKIGVPVFRDGPEVFETDQIKYNFNTKRAYISGVVTQQGDAYMHGTQVKKNQYNELFIKEAKYTTCNLPQPHYHIETGKLKVIPKDKFVSGPFNLQFNEVPTPLWLPFGIFPASRSRTSGVLFPSYGEERRRGFFLRDGGYYFAFNDYIDAALRGEIYSKGGWGLSVASNYVKRYAYNGSLNIRFNKFQSGEEDDLSTSNDFWVNWSHTPQTKGRSRVSASVSAGTSSFNRNNIQQQDFQRNSTANFNSNVSYSTSFPGSPFNLSVSARHNQNIVTDQVDLTLPSLSFNMNQLYPFKSKTGGRNNWLDRVNVRYNMNLSNRINNRIPREGQSDSIAPFNFETLPTLLERAQNGIRHTLPVSTSIKIFNNFTLSPGFNYTELWYFRKLDRRFDEELAGGPGVVTDTIDGFTRVPFYSTSASLNTRMFGTVYFKNSKVEAIRHQVTPSLSFSYQPDFSKPNFDFFQEVQTNTAGDTRVFSRFDGFIFGTAPRGEQANLGFSVSNNIEMKVKSDKDTTNTTKKVSLIDNLAFGTGYNFAADSFQLSNLNMSLRTDFLNGQVGFTFSGAVDPYLYVLDSSFRNDAGELRVFQRRINEFAFNNGEGIGQLTNARINVNFRLNPSSFQRDPIEEEEELTPEEEAELQFIQNHPEHYVDFNLPWNFSARYSVTFTKRGFEEATYRHNLSFQGDLRITEKTMISFNSGFDFEAMELTQTQLNISRDLHCWEMSLNWVPFGRFTSYNFTIRVKSAVLQDLRINRRRAFTDF